jgi:hypothetical protein
LKENEECSKEDFIEWLEDNTCTDWHKMDRQGESYGGKFYEEYYKEKDPVKQLKKHSIAWKLTKMDNFEGACELPYPRELIKEIIKIGCSLRRESIKDINSMCEWVKRADIKMC